MVRLTCCCAARTGSARGIHEHCAPCTDPSSPLGERKHVLRYEQHPRPLSSYGAVDDGGYDGGDHAVVRLDGVLRRPHGRAGLPRHLGRYLDVLDLDRLEFVSPPSPMSCSTGSTERPPTSVHEGVPEGPSAPGCSQPARTGVGARSAAAALSPQSAPTSMSVRDASSFGHDLGGTDATRRWPPRPGPRCWRRSALVQRCGPRDARVLELGDTLHHALPRRDQRRWLGGAFARGARRCCGRARTHPRGGQDARAASRRRRIKSTSDSHSSPASTRRRSGMMASRSAASTR